MIQTICYPAPYPAPRLAVRRLAPEGTAQIAALYRAGGRDGAWCGPDTVRALFAGGAVWWGGFANDVLVLCAACTAPAADTPQAAAMRAALPPGPWCAPKGFLLPPAVSKQGEALAGALLLLLAEKLFSQPGEGSFLAALPVKTSAPVLAACFAAGFAAVRVRPLVSLRPHYLLVRCDAPEWSAPEWNTPGFNAARTHAPEQKAPGFNAARTHAPEQKAPGFNAAGTHAPEQNAPAQKTNPCVPGKAKPRDALRRVYLPLADTLAVSRLLEQGFCATALCRSSADERMLICLERGAPRPLLAQG